MDKKGKIVSVVGVSILSMFSLGLVFWCDDEADVLKLLLLTLPFLFGMVVYAELGDKS